MTCPICQQKTHKRFEELNKNRYILQYIENLPKTNTNSSNSAIIDDYLRIFFNAIDTDKDGCITRDELLNALKRNTLIDESFDANKVKTLIVKHVPKNRIHICFKEFSLILSEINAKYADYLENEDNRNVNFALSLNEIKGH